MIKLIIISILLLSSTLASADVMYEQEVFNVHNSFEYWKTSELSNINKSYLSDTQDWWQCIELSDAVRKTNPDWNILVISSSEDFCPSSHMVNYKIHPPTSTVLIFDGMMNDWRTLNPTDTTKYYHFVSSSQSAFDFIYYEDDEVTDNRNQHI